MFRSPAISSFRVLFLLPLLFAAPSCSLQQWNQQADKEVYSIIGAKQQQLLGKNPAFDISTPHTRSDPNEIEAIDIIHSSRARGARTIDLKESLNLAVDSRREYQDQKETLYLTCLELTRARHDFSPIITASSQPSLDLTTEQGSGGQFKTTRREGNVRSRATFDLLLKSGGKLAVDLAQDIFQFYLGSPGNHPPTRFLAAGFSQPLLRGNGPVAREHLTQSERDAGYAIRSFSRFQQSDAVVIVTSYYRILQAKDRVRNEYSNYRNLVAFTARSTELAKDRLPRFQVDQARQDELRARNRYILAVESYRSLVDKFKLSLGIPVGTDLHLEDTVLRDLEKIGITPVDLGADSAFDFAIHQRLDLLNEIDRFADAKRRIEVAANAFQPGLDLFAGIDFETQNRSGGSSYSNFDMDTLRSRIGINLDLPLDNLDARNRYRAARIAFERQLRALSLALDKVQADLRASLRSLDLARQSFEIQRNALDLANRRVEAVGLLIDANRAQTRDLLEARNDQLAASNAVTSALLDYHLARLNLQLDLGLLDPLKPRFWATPTDFSQIPGNKRRPATVMPPGNGPDPLLSPKELFEEADRPS
jgi:outer membrane protein TolC